MCCSVSGGNTISIGQSPVANGTAGKIFPLSPEEHLRTEHLKGFLSLCQTTVSPNQLCHRDTAVCSTEGRGNETEWRRGKHTSTRHSLCLSHPFVIFFLCLFISPWHPYPSLYLSITSYPLCSFSLALLPLPFSLSTHTTVSP